MSLMEKIIYSGLIVYLLVGVVLVFLGIYLILNNKVITTNLLQNVGIFATKEVEREGKEIKPSKYITSRVMLYVVGCSFTLGGIIALINFIKEVVIK